MATDPGTVDYIIEQMAAAGPIRARRMFGEFGLYLDDRIIGLICNDTLFLKPLPAAVSLVPDAEYGPPYPGAKDYIRIGGELDDADLMASLARAVWSEAPPPKPKKPKRPRKPKP